MLNLIKKYQFLFEELVSRDFKKKYKRTVLGMGWSVLSPLLQLLVMSLVFGQFFAHNQPHYTIYLFCGNLVFSYYKESTSTGMRSLMDNRGIITKVTVKLIPLPPYRIDVLAIYTDPKKALYMVPKLLKAGVDPTSVEYMDNSYVRDTADYCQYSDMPHYEDGIYVIITVETFREDELDAKMDTVCTICEESGAVEVLEADDRIWNMRRNVQTSCEMISKVFLTDDVVVPVHKIASTIEKIMEIGENYPFQVKINAHIGDGNLHIVLCKMDMSDEEWNNNVEEFHQQVYAYAYSVGGRLAGEHGIGAKKLKYMEQFTPQGELKIMKTIKRAMDPNLILNPGKVIDA